MLKPGLVILYVDNPKKSADFYTRLFEQSPIEDSETFVMYLFDNAWKLGLWSKHTVVPESQASSQCMEVAFALDSKAAVDVCFKQLKEKNVEILQTPTALDFGYAFTALDPDNHRLRFYYIAP